MALNFDDLMVFERTAITGSLSEAARQLALTPQIASRRLSRLEGHLGVRLFNRTTRSVGLTAEGESFLSGARRILDEVRDAEDSVGVGSRRARGMLRVTAPGAFGRKILAPLAPKLLKAHPDLRIDLHLTDGQVDLIEEGLDLAVRITAALPDTSALARRLSDNQTLLVASPAYLKERPPPQKLADLADHSCLTRSGSDVWHFQGEQGGKRQIRVGGSFSSNIYEALREGVLAGAGISMHSAWDVASDIASGRLVDIKLRDAKPTVLGIWVLRPPGPRTTGQKVDLFVEALQARLKDLNKAW